MRIDDFVSSKDLEKIPCIGDVCSQTYDSIILVPTGERHDSGWMCMYYLLCQKDEIICKAGGVSDVLHLDGIGGYGIWNYTTPMPNAIAPKGWALDCTCNGFVRLFSKGELIWGHGGWSDCEVFSSRRRRRHVVLCDSEGEGEEDK